MVNGNRSEQVDFQEDAQDDPQEDLQNDSQDDFQEYPQVNFRGLCVRVALLYGLFVIFFVVVIVAGVPKLSGLSPLVFIALMFAIFPDFREDSLYFGKRLLRK